MSCCDEDGTLTSISVELSSSGGILKGCTQRVFSLFTSAICLNVGMRMKYLCQGMGNSVCRDLKPHPPELATSALVTFVLSLNILEQEVRRLYLLHLSCGELS